MCAMWWAEPSACAGAVFQPRVATHWAMFQPTCLCHASTRAMPWAMLQPTQAMRWAKFQPTSGDVRGDDGWDIFPMPKANKTATNVQLPKLLIRPWREKAPRPGGDAGASRHGARMEHGMPGKARKLLSSKQCGGAAAAAAGEASVTPLSTKPPRGRRRSNGLIRPNLLARTAPGWQPSLPARTAGR